MVLVFLLSFFEDERFRLPSVVAFVSSRTAGSLSFSFFSETAEESWERLAILTAGDEVVSENNLLLFVGTFLFASS